MLCDGWLMNADNELKSQFYQVTNLKESLLHDLSEKQAKELKLRMECELSTLMMMPSQRNKYIRPKKTMLTIVSFLDHIASIVLPSTSIHRMNETHIYKV
jgi:hypothetical protein